jgi:hypothetical protein
MMRTEVRPISKRSSVPDTLPPLRRALRAPTRRVRRYHDAAGGRSAETATAAVDARG